MVYIHLPHIVALLSSCVSFGLIIWSRKWDGEGGVLCMFCWTFSFIGSLLSLLIEMFASYKDTRPVFWRNFPMAFSCYAALFCLNASIIFPLYFLKDRKNNEFYSHCIAVEIFSCITTLGHFLEVWMMWIEPKCYIATGPGLLQVSQTYVASAIFFFLSNTVSFKAHPAVIWSLAVYCICFICTLVGIVSCARQSTHNKTCLKGFNLIAALMYLSASWPVFQLSQDLGQIDCPGSCRDDLGLWPETRLTVVVALTALNFLLYMLSVCCCCMSLSSDDETVENSTSSTNSRPSPRQSLNETQAVLPAELSRGLQQYHTTIYNQSISRKEQNNTINNYNCNIQININCKCCKCTL